MIDRTPEIVWDSWIDRDAGSLTIASAGRMSAVANHKGRVHLIDSSGNKVRLLHAAGASGAYPLCLQNWNTFCRPALMGGLVRTTRKASR